MTAAMYVPQFTVKQKLTMMVNRYQVFVTNPDGSTGPLMAFAEQKKMAFKEQVTFFTDATRTRAVFEHGQPLAFFRKDFGASLLRSTYHVEGPGFSGTGQERNMLVAVIRRFGEFPLPVHFVWRIDVDARNNAAPAAAAGRLYVLYENQLRCYE